MAEVTLSPSVSFHVPHGTYALDLLLWIHAHLLGWHCFGAFDSSHR
jgi:hypothetical protein